MREGGSLRWLGRCQEGEQARLGALLLVLERNGGQRCNSGEKG